MATSQAPTIERTAGAGLASSLLDEESDNNSGLEGGQDSKMSSWDLEKGEPADAPSPPTSQFGLVCAWFRELTGRFVNDDRVQGTIILLIVGNALLTGLSFCNFVRENPSVKSAFWTTDAILLIIFTVELTMQLIYRGFSVFCDGWLAFDFIIVLVSWSFEGVQALRVLRIFRAVGFQWKPKQG